MEKNLFKKKLAELGKGAKDKLEKLFDRSIDTGEDLVESFQSSSTPVRHKAMKQVGAGLMSLLILCGLSGCVDESGEIVPTGTVTTITETEISGITTTLTPDETTQPAEVTTASGVTTHPSETTKNPEVTTNPVVTTPTETTGKPAETTNPEEVTTAPAETVSPSETVTPPVIEDLPADADGYKYPEFFKDLITVEVKLGALDDSKYAEQIKSTTPEIVFVERSQASGESSAIAIYAKYDINGEDLYTRFSYDIKTMDFLYLEESSLYNTYSAYVDRIVEALKTKAVFISADETELGFETDNVNSQLGETFYKFIDERFVDVEINCMRVNRPEKGKVYQEISGFGYDENGNAYSFVVEFQLPIGFPKYRDQLLYAIDDGELKIDDCSFYNVSVSAIDSVFVAEEQTQNE